MKFKKFIPMRNFNLFLAAVAGIATVLCVPASADDVWRRTDAVLVQACFNHLPGEPPTTIQLDAVANGMTSSDRLSLVGYTSTKQPIYQGNIGHPSQFTAMLLHIPGTSVSTLANRPNDLAKSIDLWRPWEVSDCTEDKRAPFRLLNGQPPEGLLTCPDVGLAMSIKVASSSEHALALIHLKQRGVQEFSNLRGCREFIR